jgi:hypothetical protein
MSPAARPGRDPRVDQGRVPRHVLLLGSGIGLIVTLLTGRRRTRAQAGQTPASKQTATPESTQAGHAAASPAGIEGVSAHAAGQSWAAAGSAGESRTAAGLASEGRSRTPWLGDPRRCATADCCLLILVAAAVAACILDAHGVARLLLVLAVACVVPGCALLTRLPVEDVLEAFGLAVGLGFCIEAVGALAMVWTGWWHPFGWAIAVVAIACVTLVLDLRSNATAARKPL